MDKLSTLFGIIASISAAVIVVFKALIFMNQSSISLTLLTHEERERHSFLRSAAMFFMLGFLCFYIGFTICLFRTPLGNSAVSDKAIEESVELESVAVIYNVPEYEENVQNKENSSPVISDTAQGVGVLVAFALSVFISITVFLMERRKIECKKAISLSRYLCICSFLFVSMLLLELNILLSLDSKLKVYCIGGAVISFFFGLTALGAVLSGIRGFGKEIAYLKSYHNGEVVYLFETKGDFFVAGDNMYITDCEEFKLIEISKLENSLLNAKGDDDVYLIKKNVKVGKGSKYSKNTVLRKVVADAAKHDIVWNAESMLKVEVDKGKITYTVTADGEEKTFVTEEKPVNREEWNGNVLLL